MVQILPAFDPWGDAGRNVIKGIADTFVQKNDERALSSAIQDLPPDATGKDVMNALLKTHASPEAKQNALKNYLGAAQFDEIKRKSVRQEELKAAQLEAKNTKILAEADPLLTDSLRQQGFTEPEVIQYLNSGPGERGILRRSLEEEKQRGLRPPPGQAQQPQPEALQQPQVPVGPSPLPAQTEAPLNAQGQPETVPEVTAPALEQIENKKTPEEKLVDKAVEDAWPEPEPVPQANYKEKASIFSKRESFNNKELKSIRENSKSHVSSLLKLNIMRDINNSGKLPTGLGRIVIDRNTGEPYPAANLAGKVAPETERFVKTVNDFLGEAKAFFGGRVSNFEVERFKSRLPTLLNSEKGRRVIIEQMILMEELQKSHDDEMERALKHYGGKADYSFISNVADEKSKIREQPIINKIDVLDTASGHLDKMATNPKLSETKLFQDANGKFWYVEPKNIVKAKDKGWTEW